jgi:hypothetical protein
MPDTFEKARNLHLVIAGIALALVFWSGMSEAGFVAMFALASNLAFAFQDHFIIIRYRDMVRRQMYVIDYQERVLNEVASDKLARAFREVAPAVQADIERRMDHGR